MGYENYKAEDFLKDDFFLKWVLHNDVEAAKFWNKWLEIHPGRQAEVSKAKDYLKAFKSTQAVFTVNDVDEIWSDILQTIDVPVSIEHYKVRPMKRRLWWAVSAAVMFLFISISALLIIHEYYPVVVKTDFTHRGSIMLPDGSKVELNRNSSVTYNRIWFLNKKREVHLTGEAFFNVIHTSDSRPFIVRFDGLRVEVLGTSFNIREYGGTAKVMLERGSVKLNMKTGPPLMMNPGEMIVVNNVAANNYKRNSVNTSNYIGWKTGQMIFVEAPLEDIIDLLETSYGYTVHLSDSLLLTKKITTKVYNDDVDLLLQLLEESLPIKVLKQNKTISIQPLNKN